MNLLLHDMAMRVEREAQRGEGKTLSVRTRNADRTLDPPLVAGAVSGRHETEPAPAREPHDELA